jgi:predicted HTH domain antitoxin
MRVIAARFRREIADEVERIAAEEKVDRSAVIVRAADLYVRRWKLEKALRSYAEGKVTLWKAAGIAGLSLWELIDEMEKRKVSFQYTSENFIEDFESALKE